MSLPGPSRSKKQRVRNDGHGPNASPPASQPAPRIVNLFTIDSYVSDAEPAAPKRIVVRFDVRPLWVPIFWQLLFEAEKAGRKQQLRKDEGPVLQALYRKIASVGSHDDIGGQAEDQHKEPANAGVGCTWCGATDGYNLETLLAYHARLCEERAAWLLNAKDTVGFLQDLQRLMVSYNLDFNVKVFNCTVTSRDIEDDREQFSLFALAANTEGLCPITYPAKHFAPKFIGNMQDKDKDGSPVMFVRYSLDYEPGYAPGKFKDEWVHMLPVTASHATTSTPHSPLAMPQQLDGEEALETWRDSGHASEEADASSKEGTAPPRSHREDLPLRVPSYLREGTGWEPLPLRVPSYLREGASKRQEADASSKEVTEPPRTRREDLPFRELSYLREGASKRPRGAAKSKQPSRNSTRLATQADKANPLPQDAAVRPQAAVSHADTPTLKGPREFFEDEENALHRS